MCSNFALQQKRFLRFSWIASAIQHTRRAVCEKKKRPAMAKVCITWGKRHPKLVQSLVDTALRKRRKRDFVLLEGLKKDGLLNKVQTAAIANAKKQIKINDKLQGLYAATSFQANIPDGELIIRVDQICRPLTV
jgi:hypothetical protein